MRPWAYASGLTWVREAGGADPETGRVPQDKPKDAAMKDNILPKIVFATAVVAAVTFAIWTGLATSVEAPGMGAAPHGAYTTPF
jgi:hypothetical protein